MENKDFTYLNSEILENLSLEDKRYVNISKEIAQDVKAKKLTALEVIKKLECLLTSKSYTKRAIGLLVITETLHNLDLDSNLNNFNPDELVVLSTYFSEKLKDHPCVASSALTGILALVTSTEVPSETVIKLFMSIYNHVPCQQLQQEDRYLVFQIFEKVINKRPTEVKLLGIDFVCGVMSSIEGERNPKNLLYLFNWLPTFLKSVELCHLTEGMFEILACYFPVDFNAPASDKIKISRDDLAASLCQCITCIPDFGPYGITLALDKLASSLKIAKEDSLDILIHGCKNYDISIYFQHFMPIWSQFQKEIVITTNTNLRQKCLKTLNHIVKKLSQGDLNKFTETINCITDNFTRDLIPDSKLFSHASQILIFVAQASKTSSVIVTKKVAPFLENTFKITRTPEQKCAILNVFMALVQAVIENDNNVDLETFEEIKSALMLCSQAVLDPSEKLQIQGFGGFTEIAQFVPAKMRQHLFTNLHEFIVGSHKEVKNSFFRCLEKMAEMFPQEVEEQVLHKEKVTELSALDMYLESLVTILKLPYFESYVIDTLLAYSLDNISVSQVALRHLHTILINNEKVDNILVNKNFIVMFTDFLANIENVQEGYLYQIYLVLQSTVRNQESILQKELYTSQSTKSFRNGDVYVTVLSGLIVPMKKGAFEDYGKIEILLHCSSNCSDEFVRDISLEVLANILNKIDNEQVLGDILNKLGTFCDNCSNIETKIRIFTWIAKSLVFRNHPNAWQWTDKLIHCLDESTQAAKGFSVIMDESYLALSKENYCKIMPLYKQKFFTYVTNKINEKGQAGNCEYFTVVGYLLKNIPKQALIGQFKKIIRLILMCLENCKDVEVLKLIIQKIAEFVTSKESIIEDSFEDLFLRILNLTNFDASMTVRIAAIQCIQEFIMSYPVYKLLPFKQKAIQQLGICVDDKKRLVRREAMTCRSLWYLLDAPE